jgi:integrase
MKGQVAYATLDDQKRALRLFEKYIGSSIRLSKIKPRHAEAFIAHRLASGLSVATVNKDIRTLRRIFNLAIEPRGYLSEGQNPFGKLKQRKKAKQPIRYMKIVEYRRLLDKARNVWWRTLVSLAYGSGLRKNEILNLTWADIDFEHQLIRVASKQETSRIIEWEPEDHEKRVVPMSSEALRLLARMQVNAEDGHPYIFVSPERLRRIKERTRIGRWNSRSEIINNLRKNFQNMRCRAGLAKFTLHDFRKSAITNWAQHLPIQVVQQLAGHSDISTTREYYIAVRAEDLAVANAVLKRVLDPKQDD